MANTRRDAQAQAFARLSITAQEASARRDAELLLLHVTGSSRAELLTHPEQALSNTQLEAYFQAIERRAQSEPIQYITGVQEFYGLKFKVTPAVLIPRPETEHLVEAAIHIAKDIARISADNLRILDIGTGSGAIAVSLAHHLAEAQIMATDISIEALELARHNAESHNVGGRVTFLPSDLLPQNAGPFDIICSNPPYIAESEILETQVGAYEPHSALFAGPSGLEVYQRLIPKASDALHAGGALLLEIGYGQRPEIESLLRASHLEQVHFITDLQQIPRVAVARRSS
jgi:release factor glutamine methyltransferase